MCPSRIQFSPYSEYPISHFSNIFRQLPTITYVETVVFTQDTMGMLK